MITKFENNGQLWIDVELPTQQEIDTLAKTYSLSPEVSADLLSPNISNKIELYSDYIHIVLHFPTFSRSRSEADSREIDFIVGKDYLISVRYQGIDAMVGFSKNFEASAILGRNSMGDNAGQIFFALITSMYKSLMNELEFIQDRLNHIQDRIFTGEEKRVVRDISELGRELINFRQVMHSHEDILSLFRRAAVSLYGEDYDYYADAIEKEYQKIYGEVHNKKEFLTELRETNDSLLDTKQNEIMKNLTVVSFFTFPLSLLVGIFTLAHDYGLGIGTRYDFWIVMGILVGTLLLMLAYFNYKKWL